MATGPQRARLDRALTGASPEAIAAHADEWEKCKLVLDHIGLALATASPEVKERIGGRTGPAIDAAFARAAQRMGDKAAELVAGGEALRDAAAAITAAKQEHAALRAHPLTEPPAYQRPAGQPTAEDLRAEAQSRQAYADYQAAYADQESRAKAQADAIDRVFGHSTETMRRIHGEPDPQPASDSGGSSGASAAGGSASAGARSHAVDPTGGQDDGHDAPDAVPPPTPSVASGPTGGLGPPSGTGAPQGGGAVDPPGLPATGAGSVGMLGGTGASASGIGTGAGLGLAGATAGGAAGGVLGAGVTAGGIRGGVAPLVTNGGTATGAVRGIGATARTGVSGALGRPGGAGAVSSGSGARSSGASSRSGSGAAVGRRGSTTGSRGGAGGRSTGAVASGRGGRGRDDEKRRRTAFDEPEEWIDDEDAAPGVLA